jgi:hypothetical protein
MFGEAIAQYEAILAMPNLESADTVYNNLGMLYFKKGDLEIDSSKQVLRSSGSEMTVTVETLNKIRDYVAKLRTEMVTP